MKGFNLEDSSILGFVLKCQMKNAITFDEFKCFLFHIIEQNKVDDIPMFFWDLIDITKDELLHIDKIIGFSPYCALTDDENNAVYGISYLRGRKVYDSPVNKEQAIQLLKLNRHILDKFKNIFNFLDLSRLNDV